MLTAMLMLGGMGLVLLAGAVPIARWIGPWIVPRMYDPVGFARLLQAAGIALLLLAILVRPHNPETAAFRPPPESAISLGARR